MLFRPMQFIAVALLGLNLGACHWMGFEEEKAPELPTRYVWVDKHMLREKPLLGARELAQLREGEAVTFLNQSTSMLFRMPLDGYEFEGAFIKVRTQEGQEGWIHEKAVQSDPIPVRYRALIAFSSEEDVSTTWRGFYHDLRNLYMNTSIHVSYVVDDFEQVPIYNKEGEEMTTINLTPWVDLYKRGYVCVQSGKDPYVLPIERPEQLQLKIDAYFGRR